MNIKYFTIKRITDLVDDLSMKTKLLVLFLLFSVVLVLGVGISSYRSSSDIIDSQTTAFAESILQQVKDRVDEMRDAVLKVSIPIVVNPFIQNNDLQSLDMADYITRKNTITSNLSLVMFMKKYISSIYICNENGSIISSEPVSEKDQSNFKDYTVYSMAMKESTKPIWIGIHENEFMMDGNRYVFTFVRALYDKESFKPFGALIMNIPASVLDNICGTSSDYNIFIIDKTGNIAYSRLDTYSAITSERTYLKHIAENRQENGAFSWQSKGNFYRIRYLTSDDGDWIYVAEVPVSYLRQNSEKVKASVTVILLISIAMSVVVAYLLSSYFTVPLQRMVRTMKKVQTGKFDINLDISRNRSEIGQLADNYVIMMNKIRDLVEGIKHESREKREAEINTLQAQITPHFIYNVLNSIRCMARVQKAEGIEDTAASLIGLLQLSISKKTVFITISEEIEIIEKYVQIQNFRYGNRIRMEYEIDEEILKYMTLKFILQPLVENAILHGLEPKGGYGMIRVTAGKTGRDIVFEVEDNGVGMDQRRINTVMSGEWSSDKRFSGIGIKNINERINMYFGQEYGIAFRSMEGEYTKAVVTIPIVEESEVSRYA